MYLGNEMVRKVREKSGTNHRKKKRQTFFNCLYDIFFVYPLLGCERISCIINTEEKWCNRGLSCIGNIFCDSAYIQNTVYFRRYHFEHVVCGKSQSYYL